MSSKRKVKPPENKEPLFESLKERRKRNWKNVPVRPTPDQLATLHERKKKFGYKSLSKYLIDRGLSEGEMIAVIDEFKVDRLLYEVRRLGVNIHQIARRLNEGARPHSRQHIDAATQLAASILKEISEAIKR